MNFKGKRLIILGILLILTGSLLKFIDIRAEHKEEAAKTAMLLQMKEFLADKYGMDIMQLEGTYYKHENKGSTHAVLDGNIQYDVPYIGVFQFQGTSITVACRDGNFSDDYQLPELNYRMGDYFTKLLGYEVAFVQLREASNGNIRDELLLEEMQVRNGGCLGEDNIGNFITSLLGKDYAELTLYLPDCEDRVGMLKAVTEGLSVFTQIPDLTVLQFYVYDAAEELIVEVKKADLSRDDYDMHKFDYYYVPNSHMYLGQDEVNENTFVMMGFCELNRGYSAGQGGRDFTLLNGFQIYEYEK